ncbi:MAG: hypothetical protein NZV14_16495 [Bryobacteraceae bacterium]|nr:hypothetical protein [Bryobacteraceae bacterium]MDW8379760.1 hypothetical protein [Bryobacterales bacterium]
MRSFVFCFLLAVSSSAGADFFSGMAARAVIGQRTFTAQDPGEKPSARVLGAVSGIALVNGDLWVVDDNRVSAFPQNSRVLRFRAIDRVLPSPTAELPVTDARCPVCLGEADLVLGQPDFEKREIGLSQSALNHPTSVASNGTALVVADTDNNRVLIWRTLPTRNGQPADVVLGQPDFRTNRANEGGRQPTARSLSGPQGVWLQGNRLYVADTLNNRVLVWRNLPTQNFQPADIVLGQPNFTAFQPQDLRTQSFDPRPDNMLQPVSVTSDGTHLFVADLGHNRVLIWNRIPESNGEPADLALGQPDLRSGIANNTRNLCPEERTKDAEGKDVFPPVCKASLDFPRFALSDGTRLFVADGGNDRILVYNRIPTQNGQNCDIILGQIASQLNQVSDSANPLGRASSDSVAAPMSLAWDGTNLFVSDPFRRRILVFTPGETVVPYTGVRNAFSREIFAVGTVTFSGSVKENDEVTLKIGQGDKAREYKYKAAKNDRFKEIIEGLVAAVNGANGGAGDPEVLATPNVAFNTIVLTARMSGSAGDQVAFSTSLSTGTSIQATTSGATLSGGKDAAKIAPGTIVAIFGERLSDVTASAPEDANPLPRELGGVQVYFDGIRAPLLFVSPTEIRAQVPYDVNDSNSITAWVRIRRSNGAIVNTAAVAVPIIGANPGILAEETGIDPRPGIIYHYSSQATATVSVDGTAKEGDVATILIEDREYTYRVKANDNLEAIRDGLIAAINANPEELVEAFAAGVFTRVRLRAKIAGPEGNGIRISTRTSDGAQVILTATNAQTCCANTAYAPVTLDNPAQPGETLVVLATGLGIVNPDEAKAALATGFRYDGPEINRPNEFVSSLAGGKTANVLFSGLARGLVGIYEVHLELNSDLPTNPLTQVTIAQDIYVSNIVTFPVFNPREARQQ